jgi:hypothetical protein
LAVSSVILELVRRDLKVRYKNSVGGIAWSLFNPLMQVFVITFVMKFLLARPVENYSAYVFGAIFLWTLIQTSLLDGCVSVLQNAQLVRKIYFPRAILPLTTLLGSFFHFRHLVRFHHRLPVSSFVPTRALGAGSFSLCSCCLFPDGAVPGHQLLFWRISTSSMRCALYP